jgi:hypothetical protein
LEYGQSVGIGVSPRGVQSLLGLKMAMSAHAKANTLLLIATIACLLDGFTTWVALHTGHREQGVATAALINQLGLADGLAITILLRIAIFAALAIAIERFTRGRLALLAIGLTAAAVTWLIVLGNIAVLAHGHG